MTKKLKFVKYVVANFAIVAVVAGLLMLTITTGAVSVSTADMPVYKGDSKDKVSLMINVYWGTEYLDGMLKVLADNEVATTFFVGGMWVAENDTMLKKIYDAGHEIGNHGYHHKDHKNLSEQRNYDEMNVTHQLVKKVLGFDMKLFAPPSGSFSKITLAQAEKMGYTTVMWTRDTIDWRDHDTEIIYSRAVKKAAGGDLILMHPTENTLAALDRIIKTLKEKGLTPSKVSEVLAG